MVAKKESRKKAGTGVRERCAPVCLCVLYISFASLMLISGCYRARKKRGRRRRKRWIPSCVFLFLSLM